MVKASEVPTIKWDFNTLSLTHFWELTRLVVNTVEGDRQRAEGMILHAAGQPSPWEPSSLHLHGAYFCAMGAPVTLSSPSLLCHHNQLTCLWPHALPVQPKLFKSSEWLRWEWLPAPFAVPQFRSLKTFSNWAVTKQQLNPRNTDGQRAQHRDSLHRYMHPTSLEQRLHSMNTHGQQTQHRDPIPQA